MGSDGLATTFTKGEVRVMGFIVQCVLQGKNPDTVVRHPDFASWASKVNKLKDKAGRLDAKARATKASSGP